MKRLIDSIQHVKATLAAKNRWDPRIRVRAQPRFEVEGKRVLLVYAFGGLGDAALLAPVVRALASEKPRSIGVVIPSLGARLFKLIEIAGPKIELHPFADGPAAKEKLARRLERKRYEIAVDLSFREELDARALLEASGAEVRLGWMKPDETLESAHLTFGTADTRHETSMHWSRYLALPLRPLGVDAPRFEMQFRIAKETKKKAALSWGQSRSRLLVVPGGRQEERRWDAQRFVDVASWAAKKGASVVVVGAPNESKAMRAIAKTISKASGRRATAYTGKDLAMLVELIASASAVVTNDTGPMHIAFLLDRPTIAIFRYMSPLVWGPPRSDPKFIVLNARSAVDAGRDVWTRLVIHHLEAQLGLFASD
jgi:ADP-heptose:LPS heptosyltransferase